MASSCKFARVDIQKLPTLGGGGLTNRSVKCTLKEQGETQTLTIYQKLFELGHEGSFVSTDCLMEGKWDLCPWYAA